MRNFCRFSNRLTKNISGLSIQFVEFPLCWCLHKHICIYYAFRNNEKCLCSKIKEISCLNTSNANNWVSTICSAQRVEIWVLILLLLPKWDYILPEVKTNDAFRQPRATRMAPVLDLGIQVTRDWISLLHMKDTFQ